MFRRNCSLAAITALGFMAFHAATARSQPVGLKIAVYDPREAGGSGASAEGLVKGLRDAGYDVDTIVSLGLLTLLQYDIVYLSDMHRPGPAPDDWRNTIQRYVEAGGSVLQTWHHHILPQVSVGIQRIYGKRAMHVLPGHPAVEGIADFTARYKDHIIERVDPNATILIENQDGDPVATAGTIGKGRVISTGLALAIPNGQTTRPPDKTEMALLTAFLNWLGGNGRPSDRIAALETPAIEVSPPRLLVAAGWHADATVRVGPATDTGAVVTMDGKTLKPVGPPQHGVLTYDVTLNTSGATSGVQDHSIAALMGETRVSTTLTVDVVQAEAPADEVRGVWLHVGADRHPRDVMPELKRLGINAAVLRIAGGTAAFYASKVQPDVQDPLAEEGGDWLAEAVKYAHANGIDIIPYVNNCVVEGRTSPESLERLREAGRLQRDPRGQIINWFCPSQEVNLDAIERPMVEIASSYDIDGIQYDFIRYPNSQGCFCDACRALFEKETGKPVGTWPADVLKGGPRYDDYIEFRCRRISAVVQRTSTAIRRVNPTVKISAAVFREYPGCRESNGQDWPVWCRNGWLDAVFPMTYTHDSAHYDKLVKAHRALLPESFPLIEGIGISSGNGAMEDPGKVALHIALARRAGAQGFCGFCYRPGHTESLFKPLDRWLAKEQ
jgi:uncharacterized lipoprotein YddW (UPF0748 family)